MNLADIITTRIYCSSGLHSWSGFDTVNAHKCCNGFTPVRVPALYIDRLDEWIALGDALYNPHHLGWETLLLPDSDTELIAALRARLPHWLWDYYRPTPADRELH